MIAVYAGSFSPPTLGHLDIIRRGAALFDELIVAVLSQSAKQYAFGAKQRCDMLRRITAELSNVRIVADSGLLVDLVRREGAQVILRGLRGENDLAFEMQMAEANRRIGGIETVYIGCLPEHSMISSTIVRDCAAHGASLLGMVPEEIAGEIYATYGFGSDVERKD